jgi:hypothetical protein
MYLYVYVYKTFVIVEPFEGTGERKERKKE